MIFNERTSPASNDNIKVLKPVKIGRGATIQHPGATKEIHHDICIVP